VYLRERAFISTSFAPRFSETCCAITATTEVAFNEPPAPVAPTPPPPGP